MKGPKCLPDRATQGLRWLLVAGSLFLLFGAYAGTWRSPFLLDDYPSVVENTSIKSGPLSKEAFAPPVWSFTAGRPVLNWSFALNHSWTGNDPTGYRLGNLLIHAVNGALAFWVILEFLGRVGLKPEFGGRIAAGAAALWLLNPVNTVCVTYISQRAESLMALFYLTSLGCTLRASRSRLISPWGVGACLAFCCGVLTKETIVTAPLVSALLFWFLPTRNDSPQVSRILRYLVIYAPGLILLLTFSVDTGLFSRGGFGSLGWSWGEYLMIQARGWGEYVRLAILPTRLIFDRGTTAASLSQFPVWIGFAGLLGFFLSSVAFARRKMAGVPATLFFVLLLPTTSFLPVIGAPIAENRLYLPLICSSAAVTFLIQSLSPRFFATVLASTTLLFCYLSYQRNLDFRSLESIWRDTITKAPLNHRAHGSLGAALLSNPETFREGLQHLLESARLEPREAETHYQIGIAHLARENSALAELSLKECLRLQPSHAMAHAQLGLLMMRSGRVAESVPQLRKAVELRPERVDFRIALGASLYNSGDNISEAIACLEEAVRADPVNYEAWLHLGLARAKEPRTVAKAIDALGHALRLKPVSAEAWMRLGQLLQSVPGREAEARACLERAASIAQPSQPR